MKNRFAALALSIFFIVGSVLALSELEQRKAPSQRQGKFLLFGQLVDEQNMHLIGWTIEVFEVGEKGGVLYKVGKNGKFLGFAGYGKTDDSGNFRIEIDKSYFDGPKIKFGLRTYFVQITHQNPEIYIRDKNTRGIAVFVVDEEIKELDLSKLFKGPIAIETRY